MKKFLILLAVLSATDTTAIAGRNDAVFSKDRQTVTVAQRDSHYVPPAIPDRVLKQIAGNMGFSYPKGLYFCCFGATIEGPKVFGGQEWSAVAFTPASDATVKEIDAALTYIHGRNDIVVSLAQDDGGLPGTILASGHVMGLNDFSTCCQLATIKVKGVKVSAGTQYWVIAGTDDKDPNAIFSWDTNTTNQIDSIPQATNIGNGWNVFNSLLPAPAFAVLGK